MPKRSRLVADGKPSRVEEGYRSILTLISEDGLTAGDKLPSEAELALRFGISRPVIRHAISRLEHAGIVKSKWGSGTYVQDATGGIAHPPDLMLGPVRSLEDIRNIYQLRAAVEGEAAALAAARRDVQPLALARVALERLRTESETDAGAREADLAFHLAIASGAGNPLFLKILKSIQPSMQFSIDLTRTMLALSYPESRSSVVYDEHVAIFEAIEAGRSEDARAAMRRHLDQACRRLFLGPDHVETESNPPPETIGNSQQR